MGSHAAFPRGLAVTSAFFARTALRWGGSARAVSCFLRDLVSCSHRGTTPSRCKSQVRRALGGCPTSSSRPGGVGSRGWGLLLASESPWFHLGTPRVPRLRVPSSWLPPPSAGSYPSPSAFRRKRYRLYVRKVNVRLKASLPCASLTCSVSPAGSGAGGGQDLLLSSSILSSAHVA